MIKTIRVTLEYNTYSLWLYDESGDIIDNDNPPEWKNDSELTDAFMAVSNLYDTFFIENKNEFRYVGCPNEETRLRLRNLINYAIQILEQKNQGHYNIQNDIKYEF